MQKSQQCEPDLVLSNGEGTPETPVVIEGGKWSSAVSCPPIRGITRMSGWGFFRRRLKLAPNRRMRCNLIPENRYQWMGQAMKSGRKVPFKPARDLKEGEWTCREEVEMICLRLGKGEKPGPDAVREPDVRSASGTAPAPALSPDMQVSRGHPVRVFLFC